VRILKEEASMKAIVVVTDSEAIPAFEKVFVAERRGFTVIPGLIGMGRSGLKTGDRVHPGGSSLLFTIVPEDAVEATVNLLRTVRDGAGVTQDTRMWSFAAEELV
jgi:hypothetical protein